MMRGCDAMNDERQSGKPTIEFPCDGYHMSVIADTCDGFVSVLEEIVKRHCKGYDKKGLRVIASKNGKYQSFRFSIKAESEIQLKQLHEDLKSTGRVHMVL
ncbi:MAG: hypothetical protein CMD54_00260 [Gammaproteobacteria bacterium]|nr:hypothetical protein [Gammaproteobacteria bacterium]